MKFHTNFSQKKNTELWKSEFELKSYMSYFSRRYLLNEISYKFEPKISTRM